MADFHLRIKDPVLMNDPAVKAWLAKCEQVITNALAELQFKKM